MQIKFNYDQYIGIHINFIKITETTAMNPQFHIQIPRSAGTGGSQSGNQSNTGGNTGSSKCHVVVSVTQVTYIFISSYNRKSLNVLRYLYLDNEFRCLLLPSFQL